MTRTDTDEPLVTIITPTYNHERYIGECIESVLAQRYENWEQIIVDDGSTDGTVSVVQSFDDPRITLVTQENRGLLRLAETYNDVVQNSEGSLLAILEGDDFWPAYKLNLMVEALSDPDVGLAYGRTQLTTARGEPVELFIPTKGLDRYPGAKTNSPIGQAAIAMADPAVRTFTFPCSVVIRRTALESIGGFQQVDGVPFTDYPTFLQLALEVEFAYVDNVCGFWRQLGGSGTRVRDEHETVRALDQLVDDTFAGAHDRVAIQLPTPDDLARARAIRRVKASFDMARRQALKAQWPEARRSYATAAFGRGGPAWTFRATSLVGIVASTLRCTIEPLVGRTVHRDRDLRYLYS